jgi:hypothetical protein
MGSSGDFLVLRRFITLAARVLLQRQWELELLERELGHMAFTRSHDINESLNNGSLKCDDEFRREQVESVDRRLKEYYKPNNLSFL